ncbi:MAG: SRPBCC family protein [Actinomycetota bacterium]|nr:SRPBCC family protein [Actinomycetota bacterium]
MSTDLTLTVDVSTDPDTTWLAATDWVRQGEWIPATTVEMTGGDGRSVGSTFAARTALGPVGFTDTMEITEWDQAARRCVVRHTGRVVRGGGVFSVTAGADGGSVLHWTELLELPFGAVGRAGWPLAKPVAVAGIRVALRRFATFCERYPDR